jgi:hypothetical protein
MAKCAVCCRHQHRIGSWGPVEVRFRTHPDTLLIFLLSFPCHVNTMPPPWFRFKVLRSPSVGHHFHYCNTILKSRDSSVGIALGYGLDDRGSKVRFPAGAGIFFHHRVQNCSGFLPTSYPMGTRGSFPGSKEARGVKLTTHLHLVPRSKNEWSYTSIPPIRLHGMVLS